MKKLSDALTPNLIQDLLSQGFVKLPNLKNYISLELLSDEIISEINGRTFSALTPAHTKLIDGLGLRDDFAACLYEVAVSAFKFKGRIDNQYHISRFVSPGHSRECFRSHFDSHIFTLVLPISIPHEEAPLCSGELLLKPNARRHPKSEIENICTKLYFKRYASEHSVNILIKKKLLLIEKFTNMEPLLFLGMTTLHTNAPVAQFVSKPRLTCLAHYFDPSPRFGVGNLLRSIRGR
ncbi:hypothetical protein [Polynucleobacter sp. HIN7]|uniref:hypothetical protein n=1 Tax=Polynucleobacter sp. HIN7 TaxID=3047866 RepID=UPI002572A22C|nr:hypothetical protein [Polynucleobacter sp. HIN7]BEI36611.1 hypothetical protein PHIN7_03350 [Polynucleobacter sp. HIN7]